MPEAYIAPPGARGYGGSDVWCNDPQYFLTKIPTTGLSHIICFAYALTYANRIHYVPKALEKITGDMCLRPAGPRYAIKRKDETSKEISHLLHRS